MKKTKPVDDGIPEFLKISQEKRKEDWKAWLALHKPPPPIVEIVPPPEVAKPRVKDRPIGNPEDKDFFHPKHIIRVLRENRSSGERKKRVDMVYAHNGKTVGEFLAAGGNPTTLKNCEKARWVSVEEK